MKRFLQTGLVIDKLTNKIFNLFDHEKIELIIYRVYRDVPEQLYRHWRYF